MELQIVAGIIVVFLLSLVVMIWKVSKLFSADIQFYKANNWDFLRDSENIIRWGRFSSSPKMSGRAKIYFGYPMFLLALSGAFVFTIVMVMDTLLS